MEECTREELDEYIEFIDSLIDEKNYDYDHWVKVKSDIYDIIRSLDGA